MSEEEILNIWQSTTGYVEDWETIFSEILEELESLSIEVEEGNEDEYENFENEIENAQTLIEDVKAKRSELREVVKQALSGEISSVDVEEFFRSVSDFLREVEEKILKLREAEEMGDFEEEDYYDEEDNY